MEAKTVYQALKAANVLMDHHESDLYVEDTSEARAVLDMFPDVDFEPFAETGGRDWLE